MAERFNIYAGEPVVRVLEQAGRDNKSGRINDICARYDAMISHELARMPFSAVEWHAILDANNGTILGGGDEIGWRSTWANVMDSPELADKWDIDLLSLANRMRALALPAQAAVAEVITRFWSDAGLNRAGVTMVEALRRAGVTVAEEASDVAP